MQIKIIKLLLCKLSYYKSIFNKIMDNIRKLVKFIKLFQTLTKFAPSIKVLYNKLWNSVLVILSYNRIFSILLAFYAFYESRIICVAIY